MASRLFEYFGRRDRSKWNAANLQHCKIESAPWSIRLAGAILLAIILSACDKPLSPEEQAQIQALNTELETIKAEVASAESAKKEFSGGYLGALAAVRLELVKTNQALVQQRIHAIQARAKVTITTQATTPDSAVADSIATEVAKQESTVATAEAKASAGSAGLIGALAAVGLETERISLAMLRQRYLIAKYGLASVPVPQLPKGTDKSVTAQLGDSAHAEDAASEASNVQVAEGQQVLRETILQPKLVSKKYESKDFQDFVSLDIKFSAVGLDKSARAIKGLLEFADLFDERRFALRWTLDKAIAPGDEVTEAGSGFDFNKYNDAHEWMLATDIDNMKVKFRVDSILYSDGTRRNFE